MLNQRERSKRKTKWRTNRKLISVGWDLMGFKIYKNVAERGKWGEKLMEAHTDYRRGMYDEALMKYLLLAELGYEVAQSNAAFIMDRKETELYDPEEMWKRALVYWSR